MATIDFTSFTRGFRQAELDKQKDEIYEMDRRERQRLEEDKLREREAVAFLAPVNMYKQNAMASGEMSAVDFYKAMNSTIENDPNFQKKHPLVQQLIRQKQQDSVILSAQQAAKAGEWEVANTLLNSIGQGPARGASQMATQSGDPFRIISKLIEDGHRIELDEQTGNITLPDGSVAPATVFVEGQLRAGNPAGGYAAVLNYLAERKRETFEDQLRDLQMKQINQLMTGDLIKSTPQASVNGAPVSPVPQTALAATLAGITAGAPLGTSDTSVPVSSSMTADTGYVNGVPVSLVNAAPSALDKLLAQYRGVSTEQSPAVRELSGLDEAIANINQANANKQLGLMPSNPTINQSPPPVIPIGGGAVSTATQQPVSPALSEAELFNTLMNRIISGAYAENEPVTDEELSQIASSKSIDALLGQLDSGVGDWFTSMFNASDSDPAAVFRGRLASQLRGRRSELRTAERAAKLNALMDDLNNTEKEYTALRKAVQDASTLQERTQLLKELPAKRDAYLKAQQAYENRNYDFRL